MDNASVNLLICCLRFWWTSLICTTQINWSDICNSKKKTQCDNSVLVFCFSSHQSHQYKRCAWSTNWFPTAFYWFGNLIVFRRMHQTKWPNDTFLTIFFVHLSLQFECFTELDPRNLVMIGLIHFMWHYQSPKHNRLWLQCM